MRMTLVLMLILLSACQTTSQRSAYVIAESAYTSAINIVTPYVPEMTKETRDKVRETHFKATYALNLWNSHLVKGEKPAPHLSETVRLATEALIKLEKDFRKWANYYFYSA